MCNRAVVSIGFFEQACVMANKCRIFKTIFMRDLLKLYDHLYLLCPTL
jgi:hypothetical protein